MSARCKPGDIAIVVFASNTENLGSIVRIIEPHDGTGDLAFKNESCAVWLAESSKLLTWSRTVNGEKIYYRRNIGPIPDDRLVPIRGEPTGEHERKAREINAPGPSRRVVADPVTDPVVGDI